MIDSESPRKKLADASKVQNGQLSALSPVPKICLTKTLNQHCATGELLCLSVLELNSNFAYQKGQIKNEAKQLGKCPPPLTPSHLPSQSEPFSQGTSEGSFPLWTPAYIFLPFLSYELPRHMQRGSSDMSVMGKEAHGVTYWQICCVHKERSTGTRAWQRPLTFTECPDVGGIPLLIHIILPSQHRCP